MESGSIFKTCRVSYRAYHILGIFHNVGNVVYEVKNPVSTLSVSETVKTISSIDCYGFRIRNFHSSEFLLLNVLRYSMQNASYETRNVTKIVYKDLPHTSLFKVLTDFDLNVNILTGHTNTPTPELDFFLA